VKVSLRPNLHLPERAPSGVQFQSSKACAAADTFDLGSARDKKWLERLAIGAPASNAGRASVRCSELLEVIGAPDYSKLRLLRSVDVAEGIRVMAPCPDGTVFTQDTLSKSIRQWDPKTGRALDRLGLLEGAPMAVSRDGVVASVRNRLVELRSAITGKSLPDLVGHREFVTCLAFGPDGNAVTASTDRTVKQWDPQTGACLRTFKVSKPICRVAAGPEGFMAVEIDHGPRSLIKLWDGNLRRFLRTIPISGKSISAMSFVPGGLLTASRGRDGKVQLWDIPTGRLLRELKGHEDTVNSIAVAPDGIVLTASDDQTIRLWDTATGECLQVLNPGEEDYVTSVAFDSEGNVLSALLSGKICTWGPARSDSQG
jgi:WD40 repeat protein